MAITSMRCWWRRTIIAAGLALLTGVGLPQIAMTDPDTDAKVRDIVADNIAPVAIENDAGGLASAVYVTGHTWFFNYGLASRAEKRKITSDTLFNLASVRKVFDATLVAFGTLRGEMRLDDPINKYVTELHGDYIRRVTLGQLASHTSGVSLATDHPPWPSITLSPNLSTCSTRGPHTAAKSRASNVSSRTPVTCCCNLRLSVGMGFRLVSLSKTVS